MEQRKHGFNEKEDIYKILQISAMAHFLLTIYFLINRKYPQLFHFYGPYSIYLQIRDFQSSHTGFIVKKSTRKDYYL